MEHMAKNGKHKILDECSLPLTGVKCVDKIITEMGVMEVTDEGLELTEIWPECTGTFALQESKIIIPSKF